MYRRPWPRFAHDRLRVNDRRGLPTPRARGPRSRPKPARAHRGRIAAGPLELRVDRERQRLRLAGNVRDERDSGAESPSAFANPMTSPARIPGIARGSVIVRKTQSGLAPSVPADSSTRASTPSMPRRTARTTSGKAMTPAASAAPVHRKDNCRPRICSSHSPTHPRRPNARSRK